MNDSHVAQRTWHIALIILIMSVAIPLSTAIIIAAHGTLPADQIIWRDFDDRWSITAGSIVDDHWQVQLITNSIGLALHPIDLPAFTFQARVLTEDPQTAAGLLINAPDQLNFTAFLISGDGYMSLREMRSGVWVDRVTWQAWPHVKRDGQANVLRVACDLNRCIFFVNDEVTLQENSLTPGKTIGLIAYSSELKRSSAAVTFDQISATRIANP